MLATVKGDVHDIGKNIVGVVLGCNGYEVIDLGVMVSADTILDTAVEQDCDVVGLSGLITPSLDEMVVVAKEMERRGLALPLLIGGATTSRQHTAVRIAPEYTPPTVHVLDASRVIGVVGSLLEPGAAGDARRGEPGRAGATARRCTPSASGGRCCPSAPRASAGRRSRGRRRTSPAPAFTGTRIVEPSLAELRPYIDWTFFFHAWELKGRFPAILDHPEKGEAARDLFDAATALLDRIVDEGLLTARGVHGFWRAASDGDDIVLGAGNGELRFPMLRQQGAHDDSRPNRSLADFVAPGRVGPRGSRRRLRRRHPRRRRARGVVRGGRRRLQRDHGRRRSPTGSPRRSRSGSTSRRGAPGTRPTSGSARTSSSDERYRGIRPAFGYPACPDHSEKGRSSRSSRPSGPASR